MHTALRNLALAGSLLAATAAFADSHMAMPEESLHSIQVQHPYVRAVPPGQPNSAAFMTLHNHSDAANAVISASSPAAKVVELHTHTMDGGMMKMRRVDRIEVPAKGMVELKPGGLHIMLIGLKQQLKPGMTVSLTLNYANGSSSNVEAPVKDIMTSMDHSKGGHHPMKH